MDIPFFYEPSLIESSSLISLNEETSKHCIQVLRMKKGEMICLTNGKGLTADAILQSDHKKHATVSVQNIQTVQPEERKIFIGISILKNNARFEWFLEKATEIGVTEIIPIIAKRTERTHFRFERMQGILIAAMLQSKQSWLPVLHEATEFEAVVKLNLQARKLLCHCAETCRKELAEMRFENEVQILIGPEGDFAPGEIELALSHDYLPVALGKTRLRTETAGIVAVALVRNGKCEQDEKEKVSTVSD
ncbi:MAG: ribosomal small subunit methyltransferase [Chitinophagaceae bacterium]|nr:ribosomal small subunit methyltransferase [Chitinophagaceae bacterium]